MPLGAFLPTRAFAQDPSAIRDWAQAVEEIGYDYIDVPDHVLGVDRNSRPDFVGPYDIGDAFHETFVTLGYLAAITARVRLRSAVLILTQRQTALVANPAAAVDFLSGGRVALGVGGGWNAAIMPAAWGRVSTPCCTKARRSGERFGERAFIVIVFWLDVDRWAIAT